MEHSRREFLQTVGTSAVLMTAGSMFSGCATTPTRALEGWTQASLQGADLRRALLSYAVLAPNPHNRQPWLVSLEQEDALVLRVDRSRLLPETDPPGRQILMGHGTFLELLSQAALQAGHTAEVSLFPDGEPGPDALDHRPVARVRLVKGGTADPLFAQVLRRHTVKTPFESRAVEADKLRALVEAARRDDVTVTTSVDRARVERLRDLTWRAWQVEANTSRTWMESVNLTRVGRAEIEAHRDGISLSGPMMEFLRVTGVLTREKMADPTTSAFTKAMEKYDAMLHATQGYVWLTTPGNSRVHQVEAGRAFVRLQLKATELGLSTQPPSQVLQEYPEMAALQAEFDREVETAQGHKVQMLVRVGYAGAVDPSPRRPLEDFIQRA